MDNWKQFIARFFFRSRWIAKAIFRIRFNIISRDDYYFDLVTWHLIKVASARLPHDAKIIDMGTGPHAIVGLSLWRSLNALVTSVDVNENLVTLCRQAISLNDAPIRIFRSRFFDAIDEVGFDAVIFNPPYVPTKVGAALALPMNRSNQWDGGNDGTAVIGEFLGEYSSRNVADKVFLGVNCWIINKKIIKQLVAEHDNLRHLEVVSSWCSPAEIHIIEHTSRPCPCDTSKLTASTSMKTRIMPSTSEK